MSHEAIVSDTKKWYDSSRGTGAQPMRGYRLYFMDRFSGHIERRREFLADDDASAITIATGWTNGQPMELWLGAHKVKRWDSEELASD